MAASSDTALPPATATSPEPAISNSRDGVLAAPMLAWLPQSRQIRRSHTSWRLFNIFSELMMFGSAGK